MTYTSVTLTDAVSGLSSVLMPRDGVRVMTLDIQPAVRAVEEERVGAGGTVDTTLQVSAAAVTLTLRLLSGLGVEPENFLDELGKLLVPWARPALVVGNDRWTMDRQLAVRFDSKTGPVDNPVSTDVAISWKVPAGVWEAAAVTEIVAPAYVSGGGGLEVTSAGLEVTGAGLAVTPGFSSGTPVVASGGNMPSQWTAKLYGPCTGPKLANDAAGLAIEFTDGLSLAAGAYVQMDSQARTALLNGDPAQSVLGYLNFATSSWWLMQPGSNPVRCYPTSASAGAEAVVDFRPCWMT